MLKKEILDQYQKEYERDSSYPIKQRIFHEVPLVDLIQDSDTTLEREFNLTIETHQITDQQKSERCWAFAGLNLLRERVIETCEMDHFELSGSYLAFYDKLERFYILLERLISYEQEQRGLYDRSVSFLLEKGITDGGYFTQFAKLVNKYGIVPKAVFPETFTSTHTYEINQILSRLLRKFYLELEQKVNDAETLKNKFMKQAYGIIANVYGIPPQEFDFEYTDKNGTYHLDKNLTSNEFYHKYIGMNLSDDYVEIVSYHDEKFEYQNCYEEKESSFLSGEGDNLTLNLAPDEFQDLIIQQLEAKEPVYFYCSTSSKRVDGIWIDLMERYGDVLGVDLELNRNDLLKTNGITGCHCMIITGAHLVDQKIVRWKIENSWGKNCGNQGYYVATNDWVTKYVHRIVIHKSFLTEQHLALLDKKTIVVDKWDVKF